MKFWFRCGSSFNTSIISLSLSTFHQSSVELIVKTQLDLMTLHIHHHHTVSMSTIFQQYLSLSKLYGRVLGPSLIGHDCLVTISKGKPETCPNIPVSVQNIQVSVQIVQKPVQIQMVFFGILTIYPPSKFNRNYQRINVQEFF